MALGLILCWQRCAHMCEELHWSLIPLGKEGEDGILRADYAAPFPLVPDANKLCLWKD